MGWSYADVVNLPLDVYEFIAEEINKKHKQQQDN